MTKLKTTYQEPGGRTTGNTPAGTEPDSHHAHPATSGTDHDTDSTGVSMNQGHGHPRDEHSKRGSDGQDG
ncbi:hypothetical protein [Longimicrobium terrae]|uniref:Uncharacterized protein n=1 Tax=Longimicrobium terrae TaxID=1639882 RepID=A0A841H4R4_9BACT|nr:hypothetical protein [Longimicrobium terrae]MBB4638818.1 hypothetical protein [Longimicrobium terrae]MBB6073057.1 hypothetical protein [Longimicrobium terrae]NNC33180.1 hypothetical protein [Longimicrobium terrae]